MSFPLLAQEKGWNWGLTFGFLLLYVAAVLGSLALVTIVLLRLPATYFQDPPPSARASGTWRSRWTPAALARNFCGALLIVIGILLSLPGVPGQGILTIVVGVLLLDFPGKYRFERNLIGRPRILHAINRLRQRFGKPPLTLHSSASEQREPQAPS